MIKANANDPSKWGRWLTSVIAFVPLAAFIYIFVHRVDYDYGLEFIETQIRYIAWRFSIGQSLYFAPTVFGGSSPYFPLYFWICGLLHKILGQGLWIGRTISLLCTLATCSLIVYAVKFRRDGDIVLGIAAAGLYLAFFGLTGGFYDLYRVDALSMMFCVLAFVFADRLRGRPAALGCVAAFFVACWAKQNLIVYFPVLALVLMVRHWKSGLLFLSIFPTLFWFTAWLYDKSTDGWFFRYCFGISFTGAHPGRIEEALTYFGKYTAISLIFFAIALFEAINNKKFLRFLTDPWLLFAAISFPLSFLFRLPIGGHTNSYIPAALSASIAFAVFFPFRGKTAVWMMPICLIVNMTAIHYDISAWYPDTESRAAVEEVHKFIANTNSEVYIPRHIFLQHQNAVFIHWMPLFDLTKSKELQPYRNEIMQELIDRKIPIGLSDRSIERLPGMRVIGRYYDPIKTLCPRPPMEKRGSQIFPIIRWVHEFKSKSPRPLPEIENETER